MMIDKREYLSRLIGFYPESVMTKLEDRSFLEGSIFVVPVEKGSYKEIYSFKYDELALLLIKRVEDRENYYYVFQCKAIGVYPLTLCFFKGDGLFNAYKTCTINVKQNHFNKINMNFENI